MSRMEIAQAVVGDSVLLKAESKVGTKTFRHHPAMQDLSDQIVSAYNALLDKMLHEVRSYIEQHVVPGAKLKKGDADDPWEGTGMYGYVQDVNWPDDELVAKQEDDTDSPYSPRRFLGDRAMSLLTPAQLERIKKIIKDYHNAFAIGALGPDVLPPAVVQQLIDEGIVPSDLKYVWQPAPQELPPESMRFTDSAYLYGTHLGRPQDRRAVQGMTLAQYEEHEEKTKPKLSPVDKQAMAWARHSAGQHIRGMGDRISLSTGLLITQDDAAQRKRYLGVVREELEANIDKRAAWRDLASKIGHATGDWSRDLQRIAATEKQWAMQEGNMRAMAKGRDPDDIRVVKHPNPDACPDCIRLHLTAGRGSTPRIFKLSELQANGSNVGVKRAGWKAGVGPVHPWCGCELSEVPEGWGFDEDGNLAPEIMLRGKLKKSGPFIGPKGGKWADAKHTRAWQPGGYRITKTSSGNQQVQVVVGGRAVGGLTLEKRDYGGTRVLAVANVRIERRHRGKGHAKELYRLASEEAYAQGLRLASDTALEPLALASWKAREIEGSARAAEIPDGQGGKTTVYVETQKLTKAVKTEEDIRPHMTHQDAVPEDTCIVRIGDPKMRAVVEAVVASAPPEIFHKDVGVTLITTDTPRVQNPLDDHDFAYWTANEIRLMQTLPIERVPRVIRHELGHSLNVYLLRQLGGVDKVRGWHDDLWRVSLAEGFVSDYAMKLPIENAAEVTRMYIFERPTLMLKHPRQFAFCHRSYRGIFRKKP